MKSILILIVFFMLALNLKSTNTKQIETFNKSFCKDLCK